MPTPGSVGSRRSSAVTPGQLGNAALEMQVAVSILCISLMDSMAQVRALVLPATLDSLHVPVCLMLPCAWRLKRSTTPTFCVSVMQAQEQSPYWVPANAKPSPIVARLQAGGSIFPGGYILLDQISHVAHFSPTVVACPNSSVSCHLQHLCCKC